MNCADCAYFEKDIHIKPHLINTSLCRLHCAEGYAEYVSADTEACNDFEPKDDSWESISK